MKAFTLQQVLHVLQLHASNSTLTVPQIHQLLGNASVTFAQITYVTEVKTAAAHSAENIQKVTHANVILCSNINAKTKLYANKVKRSAANYNNDQTAVENFQSSGNYYEHTDCFSIVVHKQHADKFYLYAIYNNAVSAYVHNGNIVDEQHVAQFLTPAAKKALLDKSGVVHNKTHNVTHNVAVRAIALSNIVGIRARKQLVTV